MSAAVACDALCRLCLSSRARLLPIFGGPEPGDLADKIRACVAVQVRQDDALPTRVCAKCLDNVNNWHLFKQVCDRSQAKLESLNKKDSSHLDHLLKIKKEPLTDDIYDDGAAIDSSYPDYEQNAASSKIQPEGPPILASLGLAPRSEKKIVDPRLDWPRVEAILNLVQDDEVIDALQSAEEVDDVLYSDHKSDSEGDLLSDIEDDYLDSKEGFMTRDRRTLARMPKVSQADHTAKTKLSAHLKRPNPAESIHCPQPKHAWKSFFTKEMLEYIVECTNDHIKCNNQVDLCTSVMELEAVVGILYLHGVSRAFYHRRGEMWERGISLHAVVNAVSHSRFLFILENLRFEKTAQSDGDQLTPIRTVFEKFALNCRNSYEVGPHVVIDEKVQMIFGPCPFRTTFVNKSIRSGIKMIILVDPTTFYVSNLNVIVDRASSSPSDHVVKLVQHLAGSGKTLIIDSWFTTVGLIQLLLKEYRLFCVAALRPCDELIPPFFISQHHIVRTFMTAFVDSNIALTSFVNSNRKAINILSSHPKYYKRSSIDSKSPVSLYKQYQPAGEVLDVLTNYYTTSQNTNSWALSLFFMLLDIASVNAQVLWLSKRGETIVKRSMFIRSLALGLLEGNFKTNDSSLVTDDASSSATKREKYTSGYIASGSVRYRCKICAKSYKRDRKTRVLCLNCGMPICREHMSAICVNCGPKFVDN